MPCNISKLFILPDKKAHKRAEASTLILPLSITNYVLFLVITVKGYR